MESSTSFYNTKNAQDKPLLTFMTARNSKPHTYLGINQSTASWMIVLEFTFCLVTCECDCDNSLPTEICGCKRIYMPCG